MQPDFSKIPLHDIHLPAPVSWWPPAPGWWLLLLLVVVSIVSVIWLVRRHARFKLRRIAIRKLNALYKNYQNTYDAKCFAIELSVLLRRICISYFPQGEAAGLTGSDWLAYLDSLFTAKHNKSGYKFSDGIGVILISAPYRKAMNDSAVNADALYRLSLEWIYSLGPVKGDKDLSNTQHSSAGTVAGTMSASQPLHRRTVDATEGAVHVSV